MERLGLDSRGIDAIVLSHIHGDHTGGLGAILSRNPKITVYLLESFPASFRQEITRADGKVETVSGPRRLFDNMYSTGEMGTTIKEQALIVDTPRGLLVITGCAHPDVADMAERAKKYLGKDIYLLMGGFHLGGKTDAEIRTVTKRLKALGVRKVAPSHCTGDSAIRLFREEWKNNFVEGGMGAVIEIPLI
jgi:7,8-dihydropterin-6-yl-methyl-4-(beta-D-ribofuranosyl)aminobenzene 5'-phosphate synthase